MGLSCLSIENPVRALLWQFCGYKFISLQFFQYESTYLIFYWNSCFELFFLYHKIDSEYVTMLPRYLKILTRLFCGSFVDRSLSPCSISWLKFLSLNLFYVKCFSSWSHKDNNMLSFQLPLFFVFVLWHPGIFWS